MLVIDLTVKNTTDAILVGAAVVAALGVIWRGLVRPVIRFAKRIEKAVVNVEQQLYPNGGRSLRDAVDRLQEALGVSDPPGSSRDKPNHPHH